VDVSERTVSAVFIDLLINKRTTSPQLFDRVDRVRFDDFSSCSSVLMLFIVLLLKRHVSRRSFGRRATKTVVKRCPDASEWLI